MLAAVTVNSPISALQDLILIFQNLKYWLISQREECQCWHWRRVLVSKMGNCGLFFKEEIMAQLIECESIQDFMKEDLKLQDKVPPALQKEKQVQCQPAMKNHEKIHI